VEKKKEGCPRASHRGSERTRIPTRFDTRKRRTMCTCGCPKNICSVASSGKLDDLNCAVLAADLERIYSDPHVDPVDTCTANVFDKLSNSFYTYRIANTLSGMGNNAMTIFTKVLPTKNGRDCERWFTEMLSVLKKWNDNTWTIDDLLNIKEKLGPSKWVYITNNNENLITLIEMYPHDPRLYTLLDIQMNMALVQKILHSDINHYSLTTVNRVANFLHSSKNIDWKIIRKKCFQKRHKMDFIKNIYRSKLCRQSCNQKWEHGVCKICDISITF